MEILVPTLMLMASLSSGAAGRQAEGASATAASAIRETSGASAAFTVSARIIRSSARVGAGHGPPLPRMVPRRTTVSAADGRAVAALVYDFE